MKDTHNSPIRASYGCLSWLSSLAEVLPSNSLHCVQYHVMLYRDKSRLYSTMKPPPEMDSLDSKWWINDKCQWKFRYVFSCEWRWDMVFIETISHNKHSITWFIRSYHQISNIRHTFVGNQIVDHSDVVGASPVGAAPTTSSLST